MQVSMFLSNWKSLLGVFSLLAASAAFVGPLSAQTAGSGSSASREQSAARSDDDEQSASQQRTRSDSDEQSRRDERNSRKAQQGSTQAQRASGQRQSQNAANRDPSAHQDGEQNRQAGASDRSNRDNDDENRATQYGSQSGRASNTARYGAASDQNQNRQNQNAQSQNANQSQRNRAYSNDQNWQNRQASQGANQGQRNDRRNDQGQRDDQGYASQDQDQTGHNRDSRGNAGLTFSSNSGNSALVVARVLGSSAAAQAGLQQGDQIVSVNGQRVNDQQQFNRLVSNAQAGTRLPLQIWRSGQQYSVWLTQQGQQNWQQGQNAQGEYAQGSYGNQQHAQNDNDESADDAHHAFLGVQLDQRRQDAAVVAQVYRDSPAAQAGLRRGDTIVSINGERVNSGQDLTHQVAQLEPGRNVQIRVNRQQAQTVQVRLGERHGQVNAGNFQGNQSDDQDQRAQDNRSTRNSNGQASDADDNLQFDRNNKNASQSDRNIQKFDDLEDNN